MSSESTLIESALTGDVAAFTELLNRHDATMRAVAWRLTGTPWGMDDALQDAYLKAWLSISTLAQPSAFGSWLFRIVHNSSIDYLRAQGRHAGEDLMVEPAAAREEGNVEAGLVLRQALATLSPEHLAVITLVDAEGHSYQQTGTLLGISAGTVASRLSRARHSLRRSLAAEGLRAGDNENG